MSTYRCGLQVHRSVVITDGSIACPRSKYMRCVNMEFNGEEESRISNDVIVDEVQEILEDESEHKDTPEEQIGGGILSFLYDLPVRSMITSKVKKTIKGAIMKHGKSIGENLMAKASNLFPDSDENARPIFPGEYHAIVKLPNGKYGRSSYSGPGTKIVKRLKRNGGDPPRVLSDKVSQAHDIRYALANKESDVRDADEIYVAKMKQLSRDGLDSRLNIQPAQRAIQAKMLAEDFSLLSRDKFVDISVQPTSSDKILLTNKLKQLKQEGYGMAGGFSVENSKKHTINKNNKVNFTGKGQTPGMNQSVGSENINIKTRQLIKHKTKRQIYKQKKPLVKSPRNSESPERTSQKKRFSWVKFCADHVAWIKKLIADNFSAIFWEHLSTKLVVF